MVRGNGPKYLHHWTYRNYWEPELKESLCTGPLGFNKILTTQDFWVESEKIGWPSPLEASFETPSAALDQTMGAQETSLLFPSMQL